MSNTHTIVIIRVRMTCHSEHYSFKMHNKTLLSGFEFAWGMTLGSDRGSVCINFVNNHSDSVWYEGKLQQITMPFDIIFNVQSCTVCKQFGVQHHKLIYTHPHTKARINDTYKRSLIGCIIWLAYNHINGMNNVCVGTTKINNPRNVCWARHRLYLICQIDWNI